MKEWKRQILKFDLDIEARMKVINHFEISGRDLEKCFIGFILRAQGFPLPGVFPYWRDYKSLWVERNRERVNFNRKNWYWNNIEKAREKGRDYFKTRVANGKQHEYYELNKEKIIARVAAWKRQHRQRMREEKGANEARACPA